MANCTPEGSCNPILSLCIKRGKVSVRS